MTWIGRISAMSEIPETPSPAEMRLVSALRRIRLQRPGDRAGYVRGRPPAGTRRRFADELLALDCFGTSDRDRGSRSPRASWSYRRRSHRRCRSSRGSTPAAPTRCIESSRSRRTEARSAVGAQSLIGMTTYLACGIAPELSRQLLFASVSPSSTSAPSITAKASSR